MNYDNKCQEPQTVGQFAAQMNIDPKDPHVCNNRLDSPAQGGAR